MMKTKSDLIEGYVKEIRNSVTNFEWKVQTSLLLHNFFKSKSYEFYFASDLKTKNNSKCITKTPDFYIHKDSQIDIIGEIKQSLPNPNGDVYNRKINKDLKQIEEYQQEMVGISTPHDVFLAAPTICNEAISNYVQEIEKNVNLKNKVIIIKYSWMIGGSHSRLTISKIYGNFNDPEVNKEFNFKDYQVGEDDFGELQGYYKILYTEESYNETPLEYVMAILWHNVLPELIKSSDVEKTIERIKKGENTFEFTINEIMKIFDEIYTLKRSAIKQTTQFNKKMIIEALEGFVKLQKAQKLDDSKENPKYRITHSKISKKSDFVEYLIRELHNEEFDKKADIELNKINNQDLTKMDLPFKN